MHATTAEHTRPAGSQIGNGRLGRIHGRQETRASAGRTGQDRPPPPIVHGPFKPCTLIVVVWHVPENFAMGVAAKPDHAAQAQGRATQRQLNRRPRPYRHRRIVPLLTAGLLSLGRSVSPRFRYPPVVALTLANNGPEEAAATGAGRGDGARSDRGAMCGLGVCGGSTITCAFSTAGLLAVVSAGGLFGSRFFLGLFGSAGRATLRHPK